MQKFFSFVGVLILLSIFNMIFQFFYFGLLLQLTWAIALLVGVLAILPAD